ncbi:hypothetical protein BCR41DRAFT_349446 [Lobosporangium transversale]|uniref:Uncharacterized protein n=1 Tax=Lobosporangium transversale TaxID=64571 RepID=A0A1Y2GUK7_9FUNG|nr:hypothetical protein BCR41DRAFT_349446 [Lobosporangium transversale]ORZ23916.1 hypothetical protein BCR41DRAFT_349446 [Lobosporangium transversale]|eukprot:XP_021883730.1 hypothetical protein BCR41DRAFT_349446 [Lobosporangium transversale]
MWNSLDQHCQSRPSTESFSHPCFFLFCRIHLESGYSLGERTLKAAKLFRAHCRSDAADQN